MTALRYRCQKAPIGSLLVTSQDMFADSRDLQLPLAERIRPQHLSDVVGQAHLLASGGLLGPALAAKKLPSMILWGPPGVGKTTIARLLAREVDAEFRTLSAVMSGVKEIRDLVQQAQQLRAQGKTTLLFVDEVHRFNKGQQDAFLPHVESGLFIFVGATTENPSFELNKALLSRARVYSLKPLDGAALSALCQRALSTDAQLLALGKTVDDDALELLVLSADGDARRALGLLELALESGSAPSLTMAELQSVLPERLALFDKGGESYYELISALHKSVRGSAPDAALYWLCRMLQGGCPGNYIARRLVRMASEEIGNADPQALALAINAWQSMERLGSPEGELALAQAVLYLAAAPKSNAAYKAYNQMRALVAQYPAEAIPDHLCNAPTELLQSMGKAQGYRYAHDEPDAYAAAEHYLPPVIEQVIEALPDARVYRPVPRGLEIKIAQKLHQLRQRDQQSQSL